MNCVAKWLSLRKSIVPDNSVADNTVRINDAVSTRISDKVGWISLTRAKQINAINDDIRMGVPSALRGFDKNPDVSVIVIQGEGERGFCAGADIKEQRGPETSKQIRERMEKTRWVETLDTIGKPVIAAVHGYCMGGGMELALACDLRYAAPNIVMSLPEVNLGLIPGGGGTQRLPRLIGAAKALDLMLSGKRLNAQEALDLGVVTRVASSNETHLTEVADFATAIANKPPLAIRDIKQCIRAAMNLDLKSGLDLELDLFAELKISSDAKEAAAAFAERRSPIFSGQ